MTVQPEAEALIAYTQGLLAKEEEAVRVRDMTRLELGLLLAYLERSKAHLACGSATFAAFLAIKFPTADPEKAVEWMRLGRALLDELPERAHQWIAHVAAGVERPPLLRMTTVRALAPGMKSIRQQNAGPVTVEQVKAGLYDERTRDGWETWLVGLIDDRRRERRERREPIELPAPPVASPSPGPTSSKREGVVEQFTDVNRTSSKSDEVPVRALAASVIPPPLSRHSGAPPVPTSQATPPSTSPSPYVGPPAGPSVVEQIHQHLTALERLLPPLGPRIPAGVCARLVDLSAKARRLSSVPVPLAVGDIGERSHGEG